MQVRTAWAIVGGLWGGGVGLFFGPVPAGSLAYIVFEELWQPPYEELLFAGLWGSFVLLAGAIGFTTGSLLGSVRRTEAVPLTGLLRPDGPAVGRDSS